VAISTRASAIGFPSESTTTPRIDGPAAGANAIATKTDIVFMVE
jgi:hypothetical protein